MKKLLLTIVLSIILLTGCWDRKELNDLGIVVAIAIEKVADTDKVAVTFQAVKPSILAGEGASGFESPIENVTHTGDTIFEAVRNATQHYDRRAYFAHAKVLIIDEDLAKDELAPLLDFFTRTQEIRRSIWLVIAKDSTPTEVFSASPKTENIQAIYIDKIIRQEKYASQSNGVTLLDFINKLSASGINPTIGTIIVRPENNLPTENRLEQSNTKLNFSGTAVFNKDKLIGYLNDIETRGYKWIVNEMESGIINVALDETEDKKKIAVEIKSASSTIKPSKKEGDYFFTIEVKMEGDVVESLENIDLSKLENIKKLENSVKKSIEEEIIHTIHYVQEEYKSDIFGFGSTYGKKFPKEWKEIEKEWEAIFPGVDYEVKVDVQFREIGAQSKPLNIKY